MEGQIYAFKHQLMFHNIYIYVYIYTHPIFYQYITYMWWLKAQLNCYAFPWPVALQSCVMPCRSPVPNGGMHINVPKNEGLLQETQHIINILLNKHCRKWKIVKVCVFFCLIRSLLNSLDHFFRQLLQAFGSSQQK